MPPFAYSRWTRSRRANLIAGSLSASLVLATLAIGVGASGCKDAKRDDARNESETVLRDQAALEQVINRDLELDKVMQEADEAVAHNELTKAIALLDTQAVHGADATLAAANASVVTSTWGQGRRIALIALATDRKNDIPKYAAALKAGDLGAKLNAIQAQLALQRRAMEVQASIAGGPDAAVPAASAP